MRGTDKVQHLLSLGNQLDQPVMIRSSIHFKGNVRFLILRLIIRVDLHIDLMVQKRSEFDIRVDVRWKALQGFVLVPDFGVQAFQEWKDVRHGRAVRLDDP